GQNVKMLMPDPHHGKEDTAIADYLRSDTPTAISAGREVVGRRKDDSTFPVDLSVGTFQLNERRYFTAIIRDITDRKRLGQELRQRVEELAAAHQHKDEFLSVLSHELRNPLAPIRNALHMIKLAGDNPAVLEQARGMMERQLQQMVRLIDDLLDVSRIGRNKL